MKFFNKLFLSGLVAMTFILAGCDKEKPYDVTIPPPLAHFIGGTTQIYPVVDDPAPSYTVTIGTTDVTNSARSVTYNISSPTGAQAGVQYTVTGAGTVTIPADSTRASFTVQANYAEYASGRVDTLILSLARPSVDVADFQDTIRLVLAGPSGCNEAIPDLVTLEGNYANTIETLATNPPYGPYVTAISSVTPTSPTTALIVVENIWDNGWGPIEFNLDWTDPINRTAIVVDQAAIPGSDAGDLNPTYAGQTVAVRAPSATLSPTPGTYSYCSQTFTLKMQLGVTGLGFFNALYTVNMAR